MSTNYSLLFYLKKPKNYVSGAKPIYMRITINGSICEISTGKNCDPNRWNSKRVFYKLYYLQPFRKQPKRGYCAYNKWQKAFFKPKDNYRLTDNIKVKEQEDLEYLLVKIFSY